MIDTQVVSFQRRGDHVVLYKENMNFRAEEGSFMVPIVERTFPDSPIFEAKPEELADESAPVVLDATSLFGPKLAEIVSSQAGYDPQSDRALVEWVKAFPDNVVVRMRIPVKRGPGADAPAEGFARFARPGRLADRRFAEAVVDFNFYRLPDDGFEPRFADERIGGFTRSYKDYSSVDDDDTLFRHLLTRWDVRDPIVFYLDRAVPPQWRQPIREAAEWWNPAFAAVGVENAIQVLDPPDDPEWDPADIRHSVIYWNISATTWSSPEWPGPVLFVDPRTGQGDQGQRLPQRGVLLLRVAALPGLRLVAGSRPARQARARCWRDRRAMMRALSGAEGSCDRAASLLEPDRVRAPGAAVARSS